MIRYLPRALAGLAFALAGSIATAQVIPAPPPPASSGPPAPPYDEQLFRLSEILGAVHYLRQICGTNEGNLWRDQMQALIESEQPDTQRRARMVDRFNRGYEGFQSVYRTCTPTARLAVDRYLTEGAKIAGEVAARYGK